MTTNARSIIKRNGERVPFAPIKIRRAIEGANNDEPRIEHRLADETIIEITNDVVAEIESIHRDIDVETIQDMVERRLYNHSMSVFTLFHDYRRDRNKARTKSGLDASVEALVSGTNAQVGEENSNKNAAVISTQRDLIAGELSKDFSRKYLIPPRILKAHDEGLIHFHDLDYFIHEGMVNCCLINLKDMLDNGTVLAGTMIETPKSFATACTVVAQISGAVAASQYGGQTITLGHIAPYVDVSRQKIRARLREDFGECGHSEADEELINDMAERMLLREVASGVQTLQYQWISLQSTNGQAPFITAFMNLEDVPEGQTREDLALIIKIMLEQRIEGVKNAFGRRVSPAFPKLIYALSETNVDPGTPYYYLTELAAKCTAHRMVPDYISTKVMKELKGGVWPAMGCRAHLTPDRFTPEGEEKKYYGRFNQGVVTINLPMVALNAGGDINLFWKMFDKDLELVHEALRVRHKRLLGTKASAAPVLWMHGAYARLWADDVIDPLLYNGYSTISLGYAGLAEAVRALVDISYIETEGADLAEQILQFMNDKCAAWKKAENIDYSVYGTPLESTTQKFANALQRRHGNIENVSDKPYITNSYHIPVWQNIDAFTKLTSEARFQRLSPGGAISYVETPSMTRNIDAVLAVMRHIYDTIMYAELNTKLDVCNLCGFEGEIDSIQVNNLYIWQCPNCHNRNQDTMTVVRRSCGYIGGNYWNQGRTAEIHDRVLHLDQDIQD